MREIAASAGVNPAMVNYYFGGKEALLATLLRTLAEPLQRERLALLDQAREAGQVDLATVMAAWLDPILQQGEAHFRFTVLTSLMRLNYAALYNRVFAEAFDPGNSIFVEALCTCLPHLSRATVVWRLYAVAGIWTLALDDFAVQSMRTMSAGVLDGDVGHLRRQLTICAEACFRAPEA